MASASIHSIRVGKRFPLGLEFMRILAVAISIGQDMERDNGNVHRAAAKILQAEKAARPAAPCATYCYTTFATVKDLTDVVWPIESLAFGH